MEYDTENCIVCYKPASTWVGHVVDGQGRHIVAGWCEKCFEKHHQCPGFYGRWRKKMNKVTSWK